MTKFYVRVNGDDAPIEFRSDSYTEAEAEAKRLSVEGRSEFARSLGFALWSEASGKIVVFRDGETAGYLDANTRRWVKT